MTNTNAVTDVIEAFEQRGFEFVGKSDDGWFRLRGRLRSPRVAEGYACEIQIDPKFFELPRIGLLEIPSELPAAVPHLGANGDLCYIAKGTVVLDIFDPVGQSLACLERAESVFGQIMNGEMVQDLAEEFFAYWDGPYCMADIQGESLGHQSCIVTESSGAPLWFITDNEERTTRKLKSLGYKVTDRTVPTYRVKTNARPRPLTKNWPPRTVRDILNWQSSLDSRCRRKVQQRIQEGEKKKANGALIVIESPILSYGFLVLYDRKKRTKVAKFSDRRDPTYELEIIPLSIVRIDDRYLAQRNIPKLKTLAGKNIAIVGCGTIGGYLSEMLVKAGAGTSGGMLTLVDFESLLPQNIGRHRLGFPDLLSNKAAAMENELKRLAPGADVRALPIDVRQAQLGEIDLLIDASGEEALGHWLCSKHLPQVSMLSVWIEGPGTAVRALLKKGKSGACYRCLWHSNKRGELLSVVDPLPNVLAGHGCEGLYVPFPASVSVHAASLGAEVALDWVNGTDAPSLRTRIVDCAYQLATPDCDPLMDQDCPICRNS